MTASGLRGGVRIVRAKEVERWCACPVAPENPGYEAWLAGERAWLERWHPEVGNLFVFEDGDGRWLGKYDVPMPRPARWTLWAPTVQPGDHAAGVMAALCAHVMEEAGRRFIPTVEVLLESEHTTHALARRTLLDTGLGIAEERVLVARDLSGPLPPVSAEVLLKPASELPPQEVCALAREVGMAADEIEAWAAEAPEASVDLAAMRAGKPVGLCLAGSRPGEEVLYERHIGVCPDVRGQGVATSMFLAWLERGRNMGARTFVGSTEKDNAAMLRVFEKTGCRPTGTRLVFQGRPRRY